ncbi:hypothetical protein NIES4103_07570 [Nostoc sp. NIES-4103]|nr:hypothetical protein NIES4103_07570 [Nostoc sp. NIES-4103]
MSKIIYDVIQRFEVENGVPRLVSTNIQVIQGGEDLLSLATSLLTQMGFYDKFEENKTSQYIGYRLKNPGKGAKRYQLVLAQRKEVLCISIPKDFFSSYILELDSSGKNILTEAQQELLNWLNDYISTEKHSPSIRQMMQAMNLNSPAPIQKYLENLRLMGYVEWFEGRANTIKLLEPLNKFWVRTSKEKDFFEISRNYSKILDGKTQGKFNINELKGNHSDYLLRLYNSDSCLKISADSLFPYAWQVSIDSSEILKEFLDYFAKKLMEQY